MKLGFVSSILGQLDFLEMMEAAREIGFQCVEVACWPNGKAERRYAGVSHIDVVNLDGAAAGEIAEYCRKTGVEISALAFYPNILDGDPDRRKANIAHLRQVMLASRALGVNMVTTFIGRDQARTVEENLEIVSEVWPPIVAFAEELDVRIAIENCPMLFGADQWPGGQNLMTTPAVWKRIFEILPSAHLGINYDPSHFIWQMVDYIQPLYTFRDRIFHVHCKDIKLYPEKLNEVGIMGYPLEYMTPKIPGLVDVDWARYLSALMDIGYDGNVCIEIEDRAFESSEEKILDALRLSKRYLEQFIV